MPKKSCEEVIVATIQELRWDKKSRAVSGMAIKRLFEEILQTYKEKQVCSALENLVEQKKIVITTRMYEVKNNSRMSAHRKPGTSRQVIKKVPLQVGLLDCWCLNEFGERTDPRKTENYRMFKDTRVYVTDDGLPKNIVTRTMKKTERRVQ